jgi:DNA-directed RNA polymerase subunit beta
MYARVNDFGMIETPYAKVKNSKVTKEIVYLNALEEENFKIAHAATPYDKDGKITVDEVEVRVNGKPVVVKKDEDSGIVLRSLKDTEGIKRVLRVYAGHLQ